MRRNGWPRSPGCRTGAQERCARDCAAHAVKITGLFGLAALLFGCGAGARLKNASTSEHFRTYRAAFAVNQAGDRVQYNMIFDIIQPFQKKVFLRVEFENPDDADAPLLAHKVIHRLDRRLFVQSPPFHKVLAHVDYRITLKVFEDEAMTQLLAVHEQILQPKIALGR